MNPDKYVKAIAGMLIAGAGAVATALADGHITAAEWGLVIVAAAVGLGGVYIAPKNAEAPQEPQA